MRKIIVTQLSKVTEDCPRSGKYSKPRGSNSCWKDTLRKYQGKFCDEMGGVFFGVRRVATSYHMMTKIGGSSISFMLYFTSITSCNTCVEGNTLPVLISSSLSAFFVFVAGLPGWVGTSVINLFRFLSLSFVSPQYYRFLLSKKKKNERAAY